MIAAVGNKVEALHRHQVGQLVLPELEDGEWVYLSEQQNSLLKISFEKTMEGLELAISNKSHLFI